MNDIIQISLADLVRQAIQNIVDGNVSIGQWITFVVVLAVFFKVHSWIEAGGLYYAKYPAAKQLDDLKRQGKLTPEKTDEIINEAGRKFMLKQ